MPSDTFGLYTECLFAPSMTDAAIPTPIRVLGLSGGVGPSRRTTQLVTRVVDSAAASGAESLGVVDLQDAQVPFCDGRPPDRYGAAAQRVFEQVATADALVIGTPAYRASLSGMLKNFLDVVSSEITAGKPVAIVVTGGSRDHFLVGDYAVRPVLAALGMVAVAHVVYAEPAAMSDGGLSPELMTSVTTVAAELVDLAVHMNDPPRGER
jgi:NAD(P)H-dependent FMN reductase